MFRQGELRARSHGLDGTVIEIGEEWDWTVGSPSDSGNDDLCNGGFWVVSPRQTKKKSRWKTIVPSRLWSAFVGTPVSGGQQFVSKGACREVPSSATVLNCQTLFTNRVYPLSCYSHNFFLSLKTRYFQYITLRH